MHGPAACSLLGWRGRESPTGWVLQLATATAGMAEKGARLPPHLWWLPGSMIKICWSVGVKGEVGLWLRKALMSLQTPWLWILPGEQHPSQVLPF